MVAIGNILGAIALILHYIIFIYTWIIIISALISWVRPDPYNPIVRTLRALTEPLFWRVKRKLPFLVVSGLDLTPIVIILALYFVDHALIDTLYYYAQQIKLR